MRWYHYVSYFFGGMFLANAVPHLGNGVSGQANSKQFVRRPEHGDRRILFGLKCGNGGRKCVLLRAINALWY